MKKILMFGGTGLVGTAVCQALLANDPAGWQVVATAAHQKPSSGWQLTAQQTERLLMILKRENPDIVISSMRGDFSNQMQFHGVLADWLSKTGKKLIFFSTANVFDGDLSRPHWETDRPVPASAYGIYKRDCETMLQAKLPGQLAILRLSAVWGPECSRLDRLLTAGRTGEPVPTHHGIQVNISTTEQIGAFTNYVLEQELTGIFHVGTSDMIDYWEFERRVCETARIPVPAFAPETHPSPSFQAVLPSRSEIPDSLTRTVAQALQLFQ